MKRKNMIPLLAFGTCSLLFAGCSNDITNVYEENQKELKEQAEKLVQQCNNFNEIQVNLTSDVDGMYCGVYTEEPYNEDGALVGTPILSGLTPISTNLVIGNYVDKLYIVTRNGVMEKDATKDITENLSSATTRAFESTTITPAMQNMCDQAFPELKWNLKNEELYTCTDLKLKKATDLKITYISDGGSNLEGILYLYTYPATIEKPTLSDCTFYGIDQATGNRVKLNGIPEKPTLAGANTFKHPLSVNDYIFSNKEQLMMKDTKRTADLGTFEAGVKVGFCYVGIYATSKNGGFLIHYSFTTPSLNDPEHSLNKTAKNDPEFTYTQPVAQGCIKAMDDADGKRHLVLGMENSFPDGYGYDADFNDMMCVMEFDPEAMEVSNTLPALDLEACKYARGYYLFEDNYPKAGDYDFNDVVIQYEIKTYLNRPNYQDDCNEVKVALLAYGCSMSNEFGFYVGDKDDTSKGKFIPVFKNIQGFVNVDKDDKGVPVDPSKFKFSETMHFAGKITGTNGDGAKIRPYLKNQPDKDKELNIIYDSSFTRENIEYPYVLDVPLETTGYNYTLNFNYTVKNEAAKNFCWCKEGKKLTDAYKKTPKELRWYNGGLKNEKLVVTREEGAE